MNTSTATCTALEEAAPNITFPRRSRAAKPVKPKWFALIDNRTNGAITYVLRGDADLARAAGYAHPSIWHDFRVEVVAKPPKIWLKRELERAQRNQKSAAVTTGVLQRELRGAK